MTGYRCKYFQRSCHCEMKHTNVHLFHERQVSSPGLHLREVSSEGLSCQGDGVLVEWTGTVGAAVQWLFDFLLLLCSSWGLVPLFPWRWPFIMVSCVPPSCTAQTTFSSSNITLTSDQCKKMCLHWKILQQGCAESSFSKGKVFRSEHFVSF